MRPRGGMHIPSACSRLARTERSRRTTTGARHSHGVALSCDGIFGADEHRAPTTSSARDRARSAGTRAWQPSLRRAARRPERERRPRGGEHGPHRQGRHRPRRDEPDADGERAVRARLPRAVHPVHEHRALRHVRGRDLLGERQASRLRPEPGADPLNQQATTRRTCSSRSHRARSSSAGITPSRSAALTCPGSRAPSTTASGTEPAVRRGSVAHGDPGHRGPGRRSS